MTMSELEPTFVPPCELLADIRAPIAEDRRQTTVAVNMGLTLLYWRIGQRIHREVLGSERATYGEQIVVTVRVSRQLVADYGRGYSEKNLPRMVQLAELFPEQEVVATLSRQLSWSHFSALLPLSQPFQREFYVKMAPIEGWSVRTLPAHRLRCSMSAPRSRHRLADPDVVTRGEMQAQIRQKVCFCRLDPMRVRSKKTNIACFLETSSCSHVCGSLP
jgi:hypothetical protein